MAETRPTVHAGMAARARRMEERTSSSSSELTMTGVAQEETEGVPRAPREESAAAAAVIPAVAGRTRDARPRAQDLGLGAGERSMGTPPSSSLPARNRASSAQARTPATDKRAEAGGPDGRAETGACGYASGEGQDDTWKGPTSGREAGTQAASSSMTTARDCAGPCMGVASLSDSS